MANNVPFGFIDLQEIQNRTLETVNPQVVIDAVNTSLQVHNQEVSMLLDAWVEPTTALQERVDQVATIRMQPVTEQGQAKPVASNNNYTVAYPLKRFEHAWGHTIESMAKMTIGQIQYQVSEALIADMNTIRENLLMAILDNVSWTYADEVTDLTIKPLANSDTDTYVVLGGALETADHYNDLNAVISDSNPIFPTIFNALRNYPANAVNSQNPVISFVPSGLTTAIQSLTALIPPMQSDVIYNATDVVNKSFDMALMFGDMYLGKYNNVHIIEWQALPATYTVSWASGAGRFLKMRERENLQGLYQYTHSPDGNRTLNFYRRVYGFGCFKRTAAYVLQTSSGGSYSVPTGYTASSDVG